MCLFVDACLDVWMCMCVCVFSPLAQPLRRMSIDGGALAAAAAATAAHGGPVDPTHTGGEASHGSAGDKHAAHTDKHVTIQEDPSAVSLFLCAHVCVCVCVRVRARVPLM